MALKVIGAGLGRTGTLSLKFALEHLGFGPCCHAIEILSSLREQIPNWLKVFGGSPDWDQVFEGFVSAVDYPTSKYWRELAAHYPGAKVILSTRDAEGWVDSLHRTILSPESREKIDQSPISAILKVMNQDSSSPDLNDRDSAVAHFRQWEADAIDALPPERLLVYRQGDGWEPLCAFLGVPVPAEPYPRVNSSDDMIDDGIGRGDGSSFEAIEAGARAYLDEMRAKAFA